MPLIRPILLWAAMAFSLCAQDSPRLSFEVASVKPSPDQANGTASDGRVRLMDQIQANQASRGTPTLGSRVSLRMRTLASLIAGAWSVPLDQVEGPAWLRELYFDVDAKLPDGARSSDANEMMRSLLIDRFALHLHLENRETAGYALTVAKGGPKLVPAAPVSGDSTPPDPAAAKARTQQLMSDMMKQMEASRANGGPSGGSASRWRSDDATLSEVAAHLQAVLHKPILDATSIEGKYSVTIAVERAADEDLDSATGRALAVLGLKLEPRKLPVKVIVVESANKTPMEN